jgi:hypothetical protein
MSKFSALVILTTAAVAAILVLLAMVTPAISQDNTTSRLDDTVRKNNSMDNTRDLSGNSTNVNNPKEYVAENGELEN